MAPPWRLPLLVFEVGSPLPSRPAGATEASGYPTGSEFMAQIMNKSGAEREAMILAQLQKGNIPDFLRQFKVVEVEFTAKDGSVHNMMVSVMPDYLAIGSNDDHVLIPMTPRPPRPSPISSATACPRPPWWTTSSSQRKSRSRPTSPARTRPRT
jgi:hypothetical protein